MEVELPVAGHSAALEAPPFGVESKKLVVFTGEFKANATRYNKLAAATQYDYAELWDTQSATLKPLATCTRLSKPRRSRHGPARP